MSVSLPSARSAFEGFGDYYEAEIAPYLRARESARRRAVLEFAILIGAAGAVAALMFFYGPGGDVKFQIALIIFMLGAAAASWRLNRARDDIAHGLLERICARFGFEYRLKTNRPDYYGMFRSLGLLPNHNRERWEDEVRGEHAGTDFVFCEAHLRYKSSGKNSSTRTVFRGQIFVIGYPKRFLGTTVVKRDKGVFNAFTKPGAGFSRVGLVSSEFEKAFEAWSTDQVEARELLDPVVLERFQALERLFEGKRLRAAFTEGKLLIALESGDRINIGSMFKPLADSARVEKLLKEFDLIFDLIDVLLARIDAPLDDAFSLSHVKP
ncbi:DUF3137 domain-containing protein [Amphiplicatus metriothermophilus]|uniref:DUF3137 domain-containing protein n=1 Tax=Amphiplicatus metriothermophilus TaxID=1519374 RepID=A0A239PY09_9PROT|nr:DUF3137 domain-containing protein [Amphiplicatus metriothermophilus]MBB5519781.1 hypothetical protein [Amphiplicatus metriothermophilus]SNT75201.1 Protein of unknown function [Amphiplicatus metriothermophilus]